MSPDQSGQDSSHCSNCTYEQLEALYQLNVEAKRYAESADDAYNTGRKTSARVYSQRKKALYSLKEVVLEELVDAGCIDAARTHEINGEKYYCLYVGEFSFHTPVDEWDVSPLDAPDSASKTLDSFNADPEAREDSLSEREALSRLTSQFESPNKHIESPFVERGYSAEFVGWSSLPGAIKEGDKVDERFKHDHRRSDFLFEIGDTFKTEKGVCEILDRYHAWLTPLHDSTPILQREAYDVRVDGQRKEAVGQRRILEYWEVLADSIEEPLPDVNGKQSDMVQSELERVGQSIEFGLGDIVELSARTADGDPIYLQITEARVDSALLLCEFEPISPTEEAPFPMTISEFADDIVAVHSDPPGDKN
jgi:hypothetical protein